MGLTEKFIEQGKMPSGIVGRVMGNIMNMDLGNLHKKGLEYIDIKPDYKVLDIGCGGGKVAKLLAERATKGKVYGLDHSDEMVKLAKKLNNEYIHKDRVEITRGNVSELPFEDETFDLVTVFENIQFWNEHVNNVREIKRVLKPGGKILVVNRHPEKNKVDKYSFLKLKTPGEYWSLVIDAGFTNVTVELNQKPTWIALTAEKVKLE